MQGHSHAASIRQAHSGRFQPVPGKGRLGRSTGLPFEVSSNERVDPSAAAVASAPGSAAAGPNLELVRWLQNRSFLLDMLKQRVLLNQLGTRGVMDLQALAWLPPGAFQEALAAASVPNKNWTRILQAHSKLRALHGSSPPPGCDAGSSSATYVRVIVQKIYTIDEADPTRIVLQTDGGQAIVLKAPLFGTLVDGMCCWSASRGTSSCLY